MATVPEVGRAVRAIAEMALDAARLAEELDPAECEQLLDAILDAEEKMKTATAYLRRRARPNTVTGLGESHDRFRESMDRHKVFLDRLGQDEDEEDDDDDQDGDRGADLDALGLVNREEEWECFVDGHPELVTGKDERQTTGEPSEVSLPLTDDALILAAAAEAIRQRCKWRVDHAQKVHWDDRRASVHDVACVLLEQPVWGPIPVGSRRPSHSALVRLGQALGRLERAGRLTPAARSYERKRYYAPAEADDA